MGAFAWGLLTIRHSTVPNCSARNPRCACVGGRRDAGGVPWASFPVPSADPVLDRITEVLDPVLVPLMFARGQIGASGAQGQVIYCSGLIDSLDGSCVDLVVELESTPDWLITDVRYAGFPSARMHLTVPSAPDLEGQLAALVTTVVTELE
jgi:hypothetical protein